MNRKSGLADIVLVCLVCGICTVINGMLARSRCNNLRIEGTGNTVYQTLSPQGGDNVTVPPLSKKQEGAK